jgi:hypothetical protein
MFDWPMRGAVMSDMELEAPDADTAEQDQDAIPEPQDAADLAEVPLEANQADTVEQARELTFDDDEYR